MHLCTNVYQKPDALQLDFAHANLGSVGSESLGVSSPSFLALGRGQQGSAFRLLGQGLGFRFLGFSGFGIYLSSELTLRYSLSPIKKTLATPHLKALSINQALSIYLPIYLSVICIYPEGQYPLIKEHGLNCIGFHIMIKAIFLN